MKTIALYSLGLALSLTISTSCRKETNPPEEPVSPPTGTPATVEAMLNRLGSPLQTYTINSDTLTQLTCNNGILLMIPKNSFATQAGVPVHGEVNIEIKEIVSKKDMILNNAYPVSNALLLVSGGGLYINATQNGQSLKLDSTRQVIYYFPTNSGTTPQIRDFNASGPPNLSATNLNWLPNGTVLPLIKTQKNGSYYYMLWNRSLGWVSCNNYYNFSVPKTTCTVNLSGEFNNINTVIFITKTGEQVAARLFPVNGGTPHQFLSTPNAIPVGEDYTIGAIGYDGKDYYSAFQRVTMAESMVIDLPVPVKTTKSQIEINLAGLP